MVLAIALTACGGGGKDKASGSGSQTTSAGSGGSASADKVNIKGFAFAPAKITVKAGTTVTWTNNDEFAHTVKPDNNAFPESKNIETGASFSYTFDAPGTFPYICGIHNSMMGSVTVT